MNFQRLLLTTTLLIGSSSTAFSADEFFSSVDESEVQLFEQRNDYFLRKSRYIAGRYRLVRLNSELLLDADAFTMTFFKDAAITVRVKSVEIIHEGKAIRWSGEIVDPDLSASRLVDDGVAREDAEYASSELSRVTINAYQVAFDESARRKYQIRHAKFDDISSRRVSGSVDFEVSDTFGFYTDDLNPNSYKRFRLIPFDQEPGLHLVIEIDPSKIVPARHHGSIETPENVRKRQDYADFLESLGPDPSVPTPSEENQK